MARWSLIFLKLLRKSLIWWSRFTLDCKFKIHVAKLLIQPLNPIVGITDKYSAIPTMEFKDFKMDRIVTLNF